MDSIALLDRPWPADPMASFDLAGPGPLTDSSVVCPACDDGPDVVCSDHAGLIVELL